MRTLADMNAAIDRIEAALGLNVATARPAAPPQPVADDEDLDGQWGDPEVRYPLKEKYWKAQPDENVGKRYSQCSPEYLSATAKYLDACAFMKRKEGGEENEKKAGYKARDAARARGWAARNAGKPKPAAASVDDPYASRGDAYEEPEGEGSADDPPF